jgi:hypothetical protein
LFSGKEWHMALNVPEMEITLEIHFNNQTIRHVSLSLEKLPERLPPVEKGSIQGYRSRLSENGRDDVHYRYVNDVQILRRCLLEKLQQIIDRADHEQSQIVVTKDPEGLLVLQNCYCEHCGRLFLQHYGPIAGIIKKCSSCGRLTACRHQKVKLR